MQEEDFSTRHSSNQGAETGRRIYAQPRPIVYKRRHAPNHTNARLISDFVPLPHKPVAQPSLSPATSHIDELPRTEVKLKKRRKKINSEHLAPLTLMVMAAAIFFAGLFVSLASWHTNTQAAGQVNKLAKSAASSDNGGNPSTNPVTPQQISSYSVAADLPRYIDIPTLKVHARIKSLGTTINNQLKAPSNVFDAGWYNASSKPGQNGAMLIDGHISSWNTNGIFYALENIKPDSIIKITRGDGNIFSYKVIKSQLFDEKKVNMSSLLVSQDTSKPGLNLITCSGDVLPGTNEFNKRLVVYAVAT